jgi:hypothetical protein
MRCEKIGSISYAETESLLNHIFSIYSPKQWYIHLLSDSSIFVFISNYLIYINNAE